MIDVPSMSITLPSEGLVFSSLSSHLAELSCASWCSISEGIITVPREVAFATPGKDDFTLLDKLQ